MNAVKMKGHTFTEDGKIVTYEDQREVGAALGNNSLGKKRQSINTVLHLWTLSVRKLNLRTSNQGRSESENSPVHQHSLRTDLLESSFQKGSEGCGENVDCEPAVVLQQRNPEC